MIHILEGYTLYDKRYNQEVQVVAKYDDRIVVSTDVREWKDETRYDIKRPISETRFDIV